ncbi:hypothetical protein [Paenibacillus daejeonensis]|uniref:hypothetical protein n=1 Tax=Paenibacillus daejeonensis TaxID=135193 RepID=UPI000381584D|nr:hypothetical protein [Paenibacillus daejeonensis]
MKTNRFTLIILCVIFGVLLQACTTEEPLPVEDDAIEMPTAEDIQSIAVFDRDHTLVIEHQEPEVIRSLLQGMQEAQPAVIDDPEPSGELYELVLSGEGISFTLTLNDFSHTNAPDVTAKVYGTLPGEDQPWVGSLPSAWVQFLLYPSIADDEPVLRVTVDEDSDNVILTANRDMDRDIVADVFVTALRAGTEAGETPPAVMTWTDDRRAVVSFPELTEGQTIRFMMDNVTAAEGETLRVIAKPDGYITIHGGRAWSGLQLVDGTNGNVIQEHGFDAAAVIQPAGSRGTEPQYLIYNADNTTYLYTPGTGQVVDITVQEWLADEVGYSTDDGVRVQFAHTADEKVLYAARGLETVYSLSETGKEHQQLYHSDRAIYGMAASPDGKHVALLVDAEGNLGPSADLIILNAEGQVVSTFANAAYMNHSEGWHWIYPVKWQDDETIIVPLMDSSQEDFREGRAFYHLKDGRQSAEPSYTSLPEDAVTLLANQLGGWSDLSYSRSIPKPGEEDRYYAVDAWEFGTYLVDRVEGTANRIGSGPLIGWTPQGDILVWHSTEGKRVSYLSVN